MVGIADIYQVVDNQRFPGGELVQNVYFYSAEDSDGSAEDLSLAFNNDMLTGLIRDLQSNQFSHTVIGAQSLGNPADFYNRVLTGAVGVWGTDCLPAFNALNFTLRTASRAVRPGSKRIGGLPDNTGVYTNGQVIDVSELATMEDVRIAMSAIITAAGAEYTPVIVKRIFVPATVDHKAYYRLPETDGELEYFPVSVALVNPVVTHQTSRGNGR